MISNCSHDENGRYSGGRPGDQTGGEWTIREWYNRPWNCVLRHPDPAVRKLHADMARAAALNNCVGYCQAHRETFGAALKAAGDDPAKITTPCETDCSKGVIDITEAIGRKMGLPELEHIAATYTGNMRAAYRAAGYMVLTDRKYLTSPDYLLAGDIPLNDAHHVTTNLDDGVNVKGASSASAGDQGGSLKAEAEFTAIVTGTGSEGLTVRSWAGTENAGVSFSPLAEGEEIGVCDTVKTAAGDPWYYIRKKINGVYKYGFACAKYISKKTESKTAEKKSEEEAIYKFLREKMGLNIAAACGVLANIQSESSFIPDIWNSSKTSYGLCQWTGPREKNLRSYCAEHGFNASTAAGQLEFLRYELEGDYKAVLNTLKRVSLSSSGAYSAGYQFCKKFEIPADTTARSRQRGTLARKAYWPKYSKAVKDAAGRFRAGDAIKVNGTVTANGNGTGNAIRFKGERMYITDFVDKTVYKNYIGVGYTPGERIGWAAPTILKKI